MVHVSPVMPVPSDNKGLPEGAQQVGAQYIRDLDGDGKQELIIGYKNSDGRGGGITIGTILDTGYAPMWQTELPQDLTPNNFLVKDLDGDESPELLLFAENDNGVKQPLFIYVWTGSAYTLLKPKAGPLDGQNSFLSLHWPTIINDIDSNGTTEIIIFTENESNPDALSAVVYEWNGSEFHYTDLYIIPPRFKPVVNTE
jgi:hypothetical protein